MVYFEFEPCDCDTVVQVSVGVSVLITKATSLSLRSPAHILALPMQPL